MAKAQNQEFAELSTFLFRSRTFHWKRPLAWPPGYSHKAGVHNSPQTRRSQRSNSEAKGLGYCWGTLLYKLIISPNKMFYPNERTLGEAALCSVSVLQPDKNRAALEGREAPFRQLGGTLRCPPPLQGPELVPALPMP